jgi:hypothetical protein
MNANNKNILPNILFIPFAILMLCACSVTPPNHPNLTVTLVPYSTYTTIHATPSPSETFTPITSPTKTTTPVATLISHEWIPVEPLVSFGGSGGDGRCGFESTLPIGFTLLSNGALFSLDWNDDIRTYEIKSTTLSRQKTCNLLNSIDQAGFFEYDPSTYIKDEINWYPPVQGVGKTLIAIRAWKSNSVDLYGLGFFINNSDKPIKLWEPNCSNCPNSDLPTILPSLRKTFQILASYEPSDMLIYQSDRLGVWVETYGEQSDVLAWPLNSVKLSKIVNTDDHISDSPNIILTGANAKSIYHLFDENINVCGINVKEGDRFYRVFARPLLPNEYLSEYPIYLTTLSCSPSDGWINMP